MECRLAEPLGVLPDRASGAGAVVGASWPVRDVASNKFAQAFYDALLAGQPLAAAATQARNAASTSGDATWVSFKVFGDPHATLEVPPPEITVSRSD